MVISKLGKEGGEHMPTAKKAAVIDELSEKLGRINAAALIEYRGLTVAEIGELRTQLRPSDVEVQVAKNTLLRAAAHRNNLTELDDLFNGPNAVAFIYGDESTGTKALNAYFRTARVGEIKAGILKGGRRLTADEFAKLADLPNRQTLLAQIAGLLESPLSQLASLFNAPAQQFVYALANFEEKGGAPGAGIAAAEAPATPAAVESDISGTEPPSTQPVDMTGTEPIDAAAGEDMSEPPVVPNVAPAAEVAGDTSAAPEEAGSAAATPAPATGAGESAVSGAVSGQEEAADPTTAPESEGSAS